MSAMLRFLPCCPMLSYTARRHLYVQLRLHRCFGSFNPSCSFNSLLKCVKNLEPSGLSSFVPPISSMGMPCRTRCTVFATFSTPRWKTGLRSSAATAHAYSAKGTPSVHRYRPQSQGQTGGTYLEGSNENPLHGGGWPGWGSTVVGCVRDVAFQSVVRRTCMTAADWFARCRQAPLHIAAERASGWTENCF